MPDIHYTAEKFNPALGWKLKGRGVETFTWPELVHAAVTVGRRNWSDVLRHGNYSMLEILWRIAMLRANLRNSGKRIGPSAAYRALDQSEKGAVSFYLGLCVAKLFAERLFGVPWLLHLDVYRSRLNPTFVTAARPDFVGIDPSMRWIVLEAKGRTGNAPTALLHKAKYQTQSLSSVAGQNPALRIALTAYFSSGLLRARLVDPENINANAVPLPVDEETFARAYYAQLFDFIETYTRDGERRSTASTFETATTGIPIPGLDASIRVSQLVARWYLFSEGHWSRVFDATRELYGGRSPLAVLDEGEVLPTRGPPKESRSVDQEIRGDSDSRTFSGGDQVTVSLGDSWKDEIMSREPPERAG